MNINDKRQALVALLQAQKSVNEIMDILKVSKTMIYKIKSNLANYGSALKPRKARKRTVRTKKLIEKVKHRISYNPVRSMRKMSNEMSISEPTMRRIIKEDLNSKSRAIRKCQLLTNSLKVSRLEKCKKIRSMMKKMKVEILLYSDEKYFTVDKVRNSRNDRYITDMPVRDVPDHIKSIARSKHPSHIMVFGLVSSDGKKMPPVFCDKGFKLNTEGYLKILQENVLPWVRANYEDMGKVIFTQDGAPCHTSKATQAWLKENMKFWDKSIWPPSSPDLNPLDFSIWASVQTEASKVQHPNLKSLKKAVTKAWNNLSQECIIKTCFRFRSRVQAVIDADGGLFE